MTLKGLLKRFNVLGSKILKGSIEEWGNYSNGSQVLGGILGL